MFLAVGVFLDFVGRFLSLDVLQSQPLSHDLVGALQFFVVAAQAFLQILLSHMPAPSS